VEAEAQKDQQAHFQAEMVEAELAQSTTTLAEVLARTQVQGRSIPEALEVEGNPITSLESVTGLMQQGQAAQD